MLHRLNCLISVIAYNLIPLGIIRYIINLTPVYWPLYKIVKDYFWMNFNKLEGFIFAGEFYMLKKKYLVN